MGLGEGDGAGHAVHVDRELGQQAHKHRGVEHRVEGADGAELASASDTHTHTHTHTHYTHTFSRGCARDRDRYDMVIRMPSTVICRSPFFTPSCNQGRGIELNSTNTNT